MSRIFLSSETDPYFNVAAEYELFLHPDTETRLFLWQNQSAVVIGRNQSFYSECNMDFVKVKNILPVRRFSGGGAVFHDLGNLNFTFLDKESSADPDRYLKVLHEAVSSLGLSCNFSDRNDLLMGDKKFSGQAYFADQGHYFYHGTLMVNVDLDMLEGTLTPSFLKLRSKGIESVRSRVVNLSQLNPGITTDKVKKAVIAAFAKEYGTSIDLSVLNRANLHPRALELLQLEDWIYGESPDFSIKLEKRFSFGNVLIQSEVENGKMVKVKICTDSLEQLDFSVCEKNLTGTLFKEDTIAREIEKCYNLQCSTQAFRYLPRNR